MKTILIIFFIAISCIVIGQNREDMLRPKVHNWTEFSFTNDSLPLHIYGLGETFYCIGDTNLAGQKHGTWIYTTDISKYSSGMFVYGAYNDGRFHGIWRSLAIKFNNHDTLNTRTAYEIAAGHKSYKKIIFDYGHTEYEEGVIITKLFRFSAISNKDYQETYYIAGNEVGDELRVVYSRRVKKNKTIEIVLSDGIKSYFYFDPRKLPPTKNK